MSEVFLPVGLPIGTDTGSAYSQTVRPAQSTPAIFTLTWTVPGGEVWLPMSIMALFQTSAVAGSRSPTIVYRNQDGFDMWLQNSYTVYQANTGGELSGSINGIVNPASSVRASGDYQLSLPWLPLAAGSVVALENDIGSDAGDRWIGTSLLTVTTWDLGSSAASGGGVEQLGPYLYVPGPETVAA